jgi:hypothetical protein
MRVAAIASPRTAALTLALVLGCGGRSLSPSANGPVGGSSGSPPADAAADLADRIGPVDLSQAPATFNMTCDGGLGSVVFQMPCLVGMNLSGQGGVGFHATECRLAQPGAPLAWSFILQLGTLARDPGTILRFPEDVPSAPVPGPVEIQGMSVRISSVTGKLSFSRVDPSARAFIGAFSGTTVWTRSDGVQISCQADGPFWGAPGGFL